MKTYHVNEEGYYGNFGGAYVPEILYKTVEDLRKAYLPILESEAFRKEYHAPPLASLPCTETERKIRL